MTDVDPIAVERACAGDLTIHLNRAEPIARDFVAPLLRAAVKTTWKRANP